MISSVCLPLFAKSASDDSDKLFHEAWEHVKLYEFDRAEPIFRSLQKRFKVGSAQWIESTFGLAVSLHHKTPTNSKSIDEAKKIYQMLADKYPNHKCAARCLLNIGRIYELRDYYKDKIDLEAARKYYRFVIDRYPNKSVASEAILRLAMSYTILCDRNDVYKGIKVIEDWLKKHPDDRLKGLMYLHLGDVYFFPLEEYRKSVESYIKAEKLNAIEGSRVGFIYWRIAWVADHKLHDKKIAVEYYKKLIVDVPAFGKGYRAQLALKRLGVKDIPPLEWHVKPIKKVSK